MIESWLFVFTVVMVLLIPDIHHTSIASSTHQQGILKTLTFIPTEILGYLYGISFWALMIHLSLPTWPMLLHILQIGSMFYMFWLASRLWNISVLEKRSFKYPPLKSKYIFLTILKNPKTVLFAVGIFPFETWNSFDNYILVFTVFFLSLTFCRLFGLYLTRTLLSGRLLSTNANHFYKGSALLLMLGVLPIFFDF